MATIDSKKLLPAGKPGGSIVESQKPLLIPINNVIFKKDVKISQKLLKPVDQERESGGSLVVIKKKVLKISDVINNTYLIEQSENNRKRKERERQKAEEREKQLETRKPTKINENNIAKVSIPGKSILDTINRFIGFTLLGYLFNKYNQFLPKLIEFTKLITPVAKFVESFGKNAINGVINFIDAGYQAYDKVRDEIKNIGGEGAQKTFDEFSKNLNLILNGAIMASMLIASTAPGKKSGGVSRGGGYGAGYAAGYAAGLASRGRGPRYRSPGQAAAGRTFQENLSRQALSRERMLADVGPRGPLDKMRRGFRGAGAQLQTGTLFKRGAGLQKALYNAPGKLKGVTSSLGKVGSVGGKIFGRIPIIGGLIDFAINLAMGEDPGRAAAKAVGSTVGAALGTFIPVPFAGTILGGILGDIVGGAMYDTLVGNKKKPEARAQGGQVSGGQSTVAPSRRITVVTRTRKVKRIQPQKTQPGRDVGGKKKIEELYGVDEPGQRSALRALKDSSADVKKMKVLGGLPGAMFGAGIDLALGQKPDKNLSRDLGNIFGSVIQAAVDTELDSSFNDISKTIAMANGGVVPSREIKGGMTIGEKVGKRIATALAISIEGAASRVLNNLNRELGLEGGSPRSPGGMSGGGAPPLQFIEGMTTLTGIHKQAADIIAGYESATSGGYNAMNRGRGGDSPEGPIHYFGKNLTEMTISEVMNLQQKGKLNAAGRYQFVENTLPTAMRTAKLKPSDKFNELNQDKMFVSHLIKYGHRAWTGPWGLGKYTKSQLKILDQAVKTPITQQTFSGGLLSGSTTGVPLIETSQYGWRWGKMHNGIDLQAKSGWKDTAHMPVTIKKGGVVQYAGIAGDGNGIVTIKHDDGSITRYIHLNQFKVKSGQKVNPGTVIGRIANFGEPGFGNGTGPHLHFEYITPRGKKIDPKNIYGSYVALGGKVVPSDTPLDPGTTDKPTLGEGLPKELRSVVQLKPKATPTSVPKSTPKGEPHLVNGKMYYVDFKNNTIKDAQGNVIDVSNGKNRWLLKGIYENRNSPYKSGNKPTLRGTPQASLAPSQQSREIASLQQSPSYALVENNTILYQKEFVLT